VGPASVTLVALGGLEPDDLLGVDPGRLDRPSLWLGQLGPLELAVLADLLGLDRDAIGRRFSLLAGESQESPWVVSFPDELAAALAGLDEPVALSLAGRWADHLTTSGVDAGELLARLTSLVAGVTGPLVLHIVTGEEPGNDVE
jgi:hypothetical protein